MTDLIIFVFRLQADKPGIPLSNTSVVYGGEDCLIKLASSLLIQIHLPIP